MINKILKMLILALVFNLYQQEILAQNKPKKIKKAPKKEVLNFEDELIEGEVKKPELFYLLEKKKFNFKKLIKLRENFLPEMRRTSGVIHRAGSND